MPKNKRLVKTLLILAAAVLLLICACCVLYIYQYYRGITASSQLSQEADPSAVSVAVETVREIDPQPDESGGSEPDVSPEPELRTIQIPVDFDALEAANSDIYAWIQIPGTVIDYPVVQSPDSDTFYSNHSSDKAYYTGGSIFSQKTYNGRGFDEPMTLLYGHNLRSGNMFSQLNNFADAVYFDEHREIYIYTPDMVYRYEIFAAYDHENEHLLANHDFSDPSDFEEYFSGVYSDASLYDNFLQDFSPAPGDRIITLSTCFRQNNRRRYLVQGVLVEVMRVVGHTEPEA